MLQKNGYPHNSFSRVGRSGSIGFGRGNSTRRDNKICTRCGFINHTVDECYRKHGYPHGRKYHKPQGPSINNENAINEENANSNVEQNQEAQGSDVKVTTQQYKALMTLLQQQGSSTHNSSHVWAGFSRSLLFFP